MKKALILILLGFISCEIFAADYDFYVKSNYVNIYYKITCSDISNRTVEVVRGDESYPRPVVIPSSVSYSGKKYTVTGIGDYAFSSNPDLTSISIPNTITYIGEYAFNDTGITNLELPESLITIGRYAFTNNQHLETINFPNSISTVGENPFYKCPRLTHSVYNNTIYAAFCQDNETVIIPDGISTITRGALYIGKTETPEITSVELPASIDSLETYSIIGEFIKSIKIKAATPPKCGDNAIFPLNIIDNATVYVSDHDSAILDRYKSDPYWSNFNIVATNLSDTDNLPTDVNKDSFVNATDVVCIYNFIINGENSGISKQNADVNHDDSVDATDVVTVYNHIIMGSTNP